MSTNNPNTFSVLICNVRNRIISYFPKLLHVHLHTFVSLRASYCATSLCNEHFPTFLKVSESSFDVCIFFWKLQSNTFLVVLSLRHLLAARKLWADSTSAEMDEDTLDERKISGRIRASAMLLPLLSIMWFLGVVSLGKSEVWLPLMLRTYTHIFPVISFRECLLNILPNCVCFRQHTSGKLLRGNNNVAHIFAGRTESAWSIRGKCLEKFGEGGRHLLYASARINPETCFEYVYTCSASYLYLLHEFQSKRTNFENIFIKGRPINGMRWSFA